MQDWLDKIREVTNQMMLEWSDQLDGANPISLSGKITANIREQFAEEPKPNNYFN